MPSDDLLKEADRIMVVCNACRYCEGFCAVFPAMERRRTFTGPDLTYLANLCHDCRGCYYACQYAPPHEFEVNVPKTLAELRTETYRELAVPGIFSGLFGRNGAAVGIATAVSMIAVLLLVLGLKGPSVVFSSHTGENAFYDVIPYLAMVIPFSALGVYIVATLLTGIRSFWRMTGGESGGLLNPRANLRAIGDVLRLRYLDGGGYGCNYPDDRFSMIRRWCHHFVFYGFMLCLASTAVAAFYDHFLARIAPYPLMSWPVVLGTLGGAALLIGTVGLLYLKGKMDREPAFPENLGMDVSFLVLLFLTSLTGLLVLVLRETSAMGILLTVHIGFVAGLFITIPYGKFVHAVYRYAALVRNAIEEAKEKE